MSALASSETRKIVILGIWLTNLSYFLFSGQDAIIKLLVETFSVWQVMFFRSVVVLGGCMAFGGHSIIGESLRSPTLKPMVFRGLVMFAAWLCFYNAARWLPLAELTTIYFAAPVIVTILSILMLGERVPAMRWIAVLTGFVGVFIACDPTGVGFSWPVAMVLAAATFWALSVILVRMTALREKTVVQVVLTNLFFLAGSAIPMIAVWETPSPSAWLMLLAVGVTGGFGQYAMFEGMKRADASVIAGFEYAALIWAFLFGYLIWADVPRPAVFVGAALIIVAGAIMVNAERRRLRA
ncbi:MAG: DMT family transporter [Rhizobiaceae bacterium]|nr:DMT family transporter [Rhizobiaceae bacterium]MCO5071923.1 DMT family transporter [Rhizobiaceae bacterium]